MPQAIATRTTKPGDSHVTRRDELPLAGRTMALRDFKRATDAADEKAPLATARLVFTSGAAVNRYDWYRDRSYREVLSVEEGAIRLDRLKRGAPLLNTHKAWSLEAQLGVIENPVIANGVGECDVTFSRRESVAGYVQDVADGVIRNASVGYARHRIEMEPPAEDGGVWIYRVVDWEPYEVSLVPIPADMDSQVVRSVGDAPAAQEDQQIRTFACEFIETRTTTLQPPAAIDARSTKKAPTMTEAELQAQREQDARAAQEAAQRAAAELAVRTAERQRCADINELCARHGVAQLAAGLITADKTVDDARAQVLEEIARRDAAQGGHRNVRVETVGDEKETRMAGMQEAILHRLDARAALTDAGRQFRGMSMLELCRDFLEARSVNTRGLDRMRIASEALSYRSGMHTTSDFSHLLSNVAGARLRNAYEQNPGTYGLWARRAPNAPDFKSMKVVQLSAMPGLLQTNEHGEFKYGGLSDGAETYSVLTYGRIVALSRQAIVNDDLRGFDRMVTGFGDSARRLENATVYSQLTANGNMADGTALFHVDHNNLGTTGSALSVTSLSAMRTAMRKQTGLQGELLNLVPVHLIVPAALEQTAYQLTSANYVPAKQTDTNEFRSGGRTALDPIVEPILDASSGAVWYGAASNSQTDTVEYCYLDGAEGPVIESEMGFEVDGLSLKCRLDFAAKAIDHRGLYKATGAS